MFDGASEIKFQLTMVVVVAVVVGWRRLPTLERPDARPKRVV